MTQYRQVIFFYINRSRVLVIATFFLDNIAAILLTKGFAALP